jgi:hypothetical protein
VHTRSPTSTFATRDLVAKVNVGGLRETFSWITKKKSEDRKPINGGAQWLFIFCIVLWCRQMDKGECLAKTPYLKVVGILLIIINSDNLFFERSRL